LTADIHSAINEVMGKVGYVQKEKKQGLNYSFASEKALIEALRPAMVEAGIYMHVAEMRNVETKTYETKGGSLMNHTLVTAVIRFGHTPSNTFIESLALGEGADTGDKSANKAMTAAYKYAIRQTFCIETGDDPDNTSSDTQTRAAPKKDVPAPSPVVNKPTQPMWMRTVNTAAKEAGSSVRETLKLPDAANILIELKKWQDGNGYTDAEAEEEFKKIIPAKVTA
jgi:hypothetical protein